LIAASLAVGCQTTSRKPAYSDNPLLASRQPLVHSAEEREKAATAAHQKTKSKDNATANVDAAPVLPPPVPLGAPPPALVQSPGEAPPPPSFGEMDSTGPTVTESPPAPIPTMQPLPARTVNESGMIPAAAATPSTASRIVNGQYGYSTDRAWLQGELDRHYRGFLELRYRPASDEDTFGGKVRLDDDPRLAQFRAGDIVAVDGELIRDADLATGQYPRFRIRSIRLIERK
jgi:hypothetical protein